MINIDIKNRDIWMLKRKKMKITHSEIAKAIGVSQSAISQHENNLITLKKDKRLKYEAYISNKQEEEE